MLLSVLMLLIVCGTQGSHYLGTVVTYYTKETFTNGSVSVIVRFRYNFKTCDNGTFVCSGNCGDESLVGKKSEVQTNMWCQTEEITSRLLPNNSPFQLVYDSGNWVTNLYDLKSWRAVSEVELRSRSDTNKPNSSPQTTILPVLRVPSNCLRNINLLAFDPDGDEVRCRYANLSMTECASPCTPPPVLSLSPVKLSVSFNATSNKTEGLYAVQMVMEDFPRKQIILTQADGSQVVKTTSDAISRIPIQFGIQVDPVAPSCSEGDYLPRFLPLTPEHGARFYCNVIQPLEIKISGIANQAGTLELLFSGPHNVVKTSSGSGNFYLKWTPSIYDEGPGHPICFVIQRSHLKSVYQSELRCVIVTVKRDPVVLKLTIWTTLSLEDNKDNILKTVREELVRLGLPAYVPVRLKGDDQAEESNSASP